MKKWLPGMLVLLIHAPLFAAQESAAPPTITLPLRVHLMQSESLPAMHTTLVEQDIERIFGKVNRIWAQAGIQFEIESINATPALPPDPALRLKSEYERVKAMVPRDRLSRSALDVCYVKELGPNGFYYGEPIMVKDTAALQTVPGGIDEPLPRVTAHEIGHALGLEHRQDRLNLMASGKTGFSLNETEILTARAKALQRLSSWSAAAAMRGMWIYKTARVMESQDEREKLFAFCKQRQITDLFWQVHFERTPGAPSNLKLPDLLREFLPAAHAQGLRIHALTGDPARTLTANHERELANVDGLLAFNQASAPETSFDGLHLDIEPHGLPQWKQADDAEKTLLLTQFVELHGKVAERLRAAEPPLLLGTDIVFWLGKTKPDGSLVYPVTYRGVTRDPASHLLEIADHAAIMSYRDTALGRNGIISLVEKTIAHSDSTKARVFVGVKMADIGPKAESFFGQTEMEMMRALAPVDETFRLHHAYAGLAFFMYEAFVVMPSGNEP